MASRTVSVRERERGRTIKAVVWRGLGDIRLEDVPEPDVENPTDAIVKLTASAICGTDLHFVRGTVQGMEAGTILGHEGVGIVERAGPEVRNLSEGDRVVIASTIGCGYCWYCRSGYFAKCDNANPNGPDAGTAFFGGPKITGPFDGMQAEKVRVPYANVGALKLPDSISDDQAIAMSDIFPTGYFGADNAEINPGNTVAVFGCGPVGQFAIASAKLMRAGRIFAIDAIPSRLEMARSQGAEVINFEEDDPVETIKELTANVGADRVIDAVGVDANRPHSGPAEKKSEQKKEEFQQDLQKVAPKQKPQGDNWHPGDAPSQALDWEVECVAKAGTLSIIGVYPPQMETFPIGKAMSKNLKIITGDCNHRRYLPELIDLVAIGAVDPSEVLTNYETLGSAIEAFKAFDTRQPGWIKVKFEF